MNKILNKSPEHQEIYRKIRDKILFGELAPGQPVTILGLKDDLGAGVTPVRESIRRLTAEGALEVLENRRICVPVMTVHKLEQVSFARLGIEPELAYMALNQQDERLLSDLKSIDSKLDSAIGSGDIPGYLKNNFKFHFRLYQAANAEILTQIAHSLWLQIGPSLRIMCGKFGTGNMPDMHRKIMDSLVAKDATQGAAALKSDIQQGMTQIGKALPQV